MLWNAPQAIAAQRKARLATFPASVGGLNARDSQAKMPRADALLLTNWFPDAGFLRLRSGFTSSVTGLGSAINTLMEWAGPASRKLKAATATDIYDVSTPGAVGAAEVSSLTNGRWQSVNFTTAGGAFLVCANGADSVRNYDGTSWTTPSITGVTSSTLINVASYGQRLWFVQADSTKAWYLPTNSIAGAAVAFDLGSVFQRGGKLKIIVPLSYGTATGGSDFLAFISSTGEIALYSGSDPASPTTWTLAARFRVGAPVGDRAALRVSGDAALITEDGIVSIRQMAQLDRGGSGAEKATITDKINDLFANAFGSYGALYGWQCLAYPRGHRALINVPTSTTTAFQYVMNLQTGAWCKFEGMDGLCWGLYGEDIYFGTSAGTVYKAENGTDDAGAAIAWEIRTAFWDCGVKELKRMTNIRPMIGANSSVSLAFGVDMDFANTMPSLSDAFSTPSPSGALWDVAQWDVDLWVGDDEIYRDWYAVNAVIGNYASVHMRGTASGLSAKMYAVDAMYEVQARVSL